MFYQQGYFYDTVNTPVAPVPLLMLCTPTIHSPSSLQKKCIIEETPKKLVFAWAGVYINFIEVGDAAVPVVRTD